MGADHTPPAIDPGPGSLAELEARIARELLALNIPPRDWVPGHTHPVHGKMLDVAIVGAGMSGLAVAYALMRLGLRNMRLFDRAPADLEGPWATYARMETLRSPKELAGPALGMGNLTFRAWFEAQFGAAAWQRLGKIPRLQWMDYLRWYRRMLGVPIDNDVQLVDLSGDAAGVVMALRKQGAVRRIAARRVVLATGRDGLGGPFVPALFRALDRRFWAHSSDKIDFAALAGKTVGVIGAGASAVDNAACALEAGAKRVAMVVRRNDVPRVNKGMGVANPGMSLGFQRLEPAQRWAMNQYIADCAIPPPRDSMLRAARHRNFAVLTGCELHRLQAEDGQVLLDTPRGMLAFDFLVLATGFAVDWSQRPEFAGLAPLVLRWRDRYLPDGMETAEGADHPFLGADMEFLPRNAEEASWVTRVHCLNFAATLSHGKVTGDIPAISVGAERLANAIVGLLFTEDYAEHYRRLVGYATPELRGDEWNHDNDPAPFLWRTSAKRAGE